MTPRSMPTSSSCLQANQSLLAARDRLEQARSIARVATAEMFPQVSTDPSALREGAGTNRPLNGAAVPTSLHAECFHGSVQHQL